MKRISSLFLILSLLIVSSCNSNVAWNSGNICEDDQIYSQKDCTCIEDSAGCNGLSQEVCEQSEYCFSFSRGGSCSCPTCKDLLAHQCLPNSWVEIDPIQCLGNPWEIDWLKDNDDYPRDVHTLELEQGEEDIIKEYYLKQGVSILKVESEWTHDIVCEACSCPQGYTLYLLVSDVDKMIKLGHKISEFK